MNLSDLNHGVQQGVNSMSRNIFQFSFQLNTPSVRVGLISKTTWFSDKPCLQSVLNYSTMLGNLSFQLYLRPLNLCLAISILVSTVTQPKLVFMCVKTFHLP